MRRWIGCALLVTAACRRPAPGRAEQEAGAPEGGGVLPNASAGTGAAPSMPGLLTPDASSGDASKELVTRRKLLCARIGMSTASLTASAELSLEDRAAEGGSVSVYERDGYVRMDGAMLGESVREHFDYRFAGKDLVCARTITTSVHTVMEQTADNPEGVPPFWRADFRVFDGARVVHATVDEAPGPDERAASAGETAAQAARLRERYGAVKAKR